MAVEVIVRLYFVDSPPTEDDLRRTLEDELDCDVMYVEEEEV
jgi:hypothetical protein